MEFGLGSLLVDCWGQHIRVVSDNTTAVSYINGIESKSLPSDSITGTIWSWAIDRGNWLSAARVPEMSNVSADDLSLIFKADTEWKLSNDVFPGCEVSAGCQIWTFSRGRLNHKVPKYASCKPDLLASFVDALTHEFSNAYAFPPFCLVGRCLQKVMLPQATFAVVILLWCTQAWFTRLLSLLIDHPRFVRVTKRVFSNPILGQMHPISPKLYLLVCRIPGKGLLSETFRETLPKSSCGCGEKEHRNNMACISGNGTSFVFKGKLIQCRPLCMRFLA